ncbi:MAG: gliding motility-associated C-terminal domain-containing protein [Paramuribaculum sp.]|nr:gliding motility-associated C-terminal domain-containing protein [Paramuribaculum sp.]
MVRTILTLIISLTAALPSVASITIEGTSLTPVSIDPNAASGLSNIYVVNDFAGCRLVYTASSSATVECSRYGIRGASYHEAISEADISRQGNTTVITNITANSGYAFTEGTRTTYCWVCSYSLTPFTIDGLTPDQSETYCDRMVLTASGAADRMLYYGIDGRAYTIDRGIKLSYRSLQPVDGSEEPAFQSVTKEEIFPYIDGSLNIEAPLCDTYVTLTGDRFLRAWGREAEIVSSAITCRAVQGLTSAVQNKVPGESELRTEDVLGGSAPIEIEFTAAVTDAAVYTRWQMATDPDFTNVTFYTSDLQFTHTFMDTGVRYIQFEAADASGQCTAESDIYTVNIGESSLLCPNAFSPGASEGVNDEWRVSYKSIVKFDCYIFNRWGKKMTEFHNPAQGWDGTFNGKLVPAGVYYYVIKAKGSDGKSYDLSGDINILRSSVK